jgi:transcriptional regulator with XRE-family HTH domain
MKRDSERMFDVTNEPTIRQVERMSILPNELIAAALHRERARSGMSLSALAREAGIAKSTLSQLEAGKGNPSIETLWQLATALGVPFAALLEQPAPDKTLIPLSDTLGVASDHSDYITALLSSCPAHARRDIYRVILQPGEPRVSPGHPIGTREHVIVCQGTAEVGAQNATELLKVGDYLAFRADQPHIYAATTPDTVLLVVMESD